jgi:hypothetical protein
MSCRAHLARTYDRECEFVAALRGHEHAEPATANENEMIARIALDEQHLTGADPAHRRVVRERVKRVGRDLAEQFDRGQVSATVRGMGSVCRVIRPIP